MWMRLYIRHDYRCAKVTQSRCHSADNRDVAIASKLRDMRIVVLEHSKRQREACIHLRVSLILLVQRREASLPQSSASKTKAATSNLQAAGPPSVGASPCPMSSPFGTSCSVSYGVDEGDLSSFCVMASVGCGSMTVVSSTFPVARDMMICRDRVRTQSQMLGFLIMEVT